MRYHCITSKTRRLPGADRRRERHLRKGWKGCTVLDCLGVEGSEWYSAEAAEELRAAIAAGSSP